MLEIVSSIVQSIKADQLLYKGLYIVNAARPTVLTENETSTTIDYYKTTIQLLQTWSLAPLVCVVQLDRVQWINNSKCTTITVFTLSLTNKEMHSVRS